jgi:hypothetical protein
MPAIPPGTLRQLDVSLAFMLLLTWVGTAIGGDNLRYRGDYTLGHEVNIFCPRINSQCYWLSATTPGTIRQTLRILVEAHRYPGYSPVCLVVEGSIDRTSTREGFAADYDGLITMNKVYGVCDQTSIVTPGDLQHHRWILTRVDDQLVSRAKSHAGPSLEIGEQLSFEAHDHARSVNGFATLAGENIVFKPARQDRARFPDSAVTTVELTRLLQGAWRITLPATKTLLLEGSGIELEFTLSDWR